METEKIIDVTPYIWGFIAGSILITVLALAGTNAMYINKAVIIEGVESCNANGGLRRISVYNAIHCKNGVIFR